MKVRRIPRVPPKRPASKTTLSRGEAWPDSAGGDADVLLVVQSSRANANAAKSTSCASSRRRSSVVVPGLKEVVQGSTCATSSRPRVSACSSFSCFPDEPRKMRGLSIPSSRQQVGLREQSPSATVSYRRIPTSSRPGSSRRPMEIEYELTPEDQYAFQWRAVFAAALWRTRGRLADATAVQLTPCTDWQPCSWSACSC